MRWWPVLAFAAGCSFRLNASTSAGPDGGSNGADAASDGRVATDGTAVDAPADAAFDPASCPAGYTVTVSASPGSRYRWITANRDWGTQRADCEDDLPGTTHLAVFDTPAEAQQIAAATVTTYYHVGAVQPLGQSGVAVGWLWVTGEPVPDAQWYAGQPNDTDGVENDQQDRGAVNTSVGSGIQDVEITYATAAVCECDGRGVAPSVIAILP